MQDFSPEPITVHRVWGQVATRLHLGPSLYSALSLCHGRRKSNGSVCLFH